MKKKIQFLISMVLCLVMAASLPLTAYADKAEAEYVSDLQVVYADSYEAASAQLEDGYTAINLQLGATGGTWLAYKSTTDKNDAITDIAVMNMNGGYSYDEFDKMLANKKKEIKNYVSELMTAVNEYRTNYKANEPGALYAYDVLNKLLEDDYDNQGMGDLLISDKAEEALNSICLESSPLAIDTIITYLGIACTKDWIGDLLANGDQQEYDAETAANAQKLYDLLPDFYEGLMKYEDSGLSLSTMTQDEINAYIDKNDSDMINMLTFGAAYETLNSVEYNDGTLLEALFKNPDEIEVNDLCPIAAAMSEGMLVTITSLGLEKAVSYSGATAEDFEQLKANEELENVEPTSVFAGIDRSIYEGEGVAMTSEAIRAYSSGSKAEGIATIPKVLLILSAIAITGAMITLGVLYGVHCYIKAVNMSSLVLNAAQIGMLKKTITIGNMVLAVLTVIAVLCYVTALLLQKLIYDKRSVSYTPIPRVIIDQVIENDQENLFAYKAVKDTTGKYADINNWTGQQWNALYYTKNTNAGSPLTTEFFSNIDAGSLYEKTTTVVHGFGTKAAYNLNSYGSKTGDAIYIAFVPDDESSSSANAAATSVSFTWYAVTAAAGLLVGILGTYFIGKASKKKKKAEA